MECPNHDILLLITITIAALLSSAASTNRRTTLTPLRYYSTILGGLHQSPHYYHLGCLSTSAVMVATVLHRRASILGCLNNPMVVIVATIHQLPCYYLPSMIKTNMVER
jgi:hypothetical protein